MCNLGFQVGKRTWSDLNNVSFTKWDEEKRGEFLASFNAKNQRKRRSRTIYDFKSKKKKETDSRKRKQSVGMFSRDELAREVKKRTKNSRGGERQEG